MAVIIVAAILMIVAMRGWTAVAPTVEQIQSVQQPSNRPVTPRTESAPPGQGGGGEMPRLGEMKERTDAHAAGVKEAAESTNR